MANYIRGYWSWVYILFLKKKIKLISNRVDSAGLIYARHIAFKLEERTASSIIMK